jgi:hypothetical protein
MKKIIAVITAVFFVIGLSSCATLFTPPQDSKGKSARLLKYERDEQTRALVVKGAATFVGFVLGGIAAVYMTPSGNAVAGITAGCILGGAAGFGLGHIIFENTKPVRGTPEDELINEQFKVYKYIQHKE